VRPRGRERFTVYETLKSSGLFQMSFEHVGGVVLECGERNEKRMGQNPACLVNNMIIASSSSKGVRLLTRHSDSCFTIYQGLQALKNCIIPSGDAL